MTFDTVQIYFIFGENTTKNVTFLDTEKVKNVKQMLGNRRYNNIMEKIYSTVRKVKTKNTEFSYFWIYFQFQNK